MLTAKKEMDS